MLSSIYAKQQTPEINVYTARKEELIRELFAEFTKTTGIKINFISDEASKLIARIENEGSATPADLLMTSDIMTLNLAKKKDILAPVHSKMLQEAIPGYLRDIDSEWFGLTIRARVILYAKDKIKPSEISDYEDLALPKWKNQILIRSSKNVYNQSLVAYMIEARGIEETRKWIRGLVSNFTRRPQGGDTDQIKALISGEGSIAIANTYYFARLIESDKQVAEKVGIIFPNQNNRGTHINISGAAVVKHAKNPENAIKLLEFLASPKAQYIYAKQNHEYPVLSGVESSAILKNWGSYKADEVSLSTIAEHAKTAMIIANEADWR
jgi:iron(III) transport system substrate-binding protein